MAVSTTSAVFDRVLCGASACPGSIEAVRQAARLVSPRGTLRVVACADLGAAAAAGYLATQAAEELHGEAARALEAAAGVAPEAAVELIHGQAVATLLTEIEARDVTLVAVGPGSHSRLGGIVLGRVATSLLHEAPCSVLVARQPAAPERFPRSIVVGLDGSERSADAAAAAADVARRTGASVTGIVALGGKGVDADAGRSLLPRVLLNDGPPLDVLLGAAERADLLVVGSRGLHGVPALGSVSERVAHRARCSVLVVRIP
jgi:nucleotide-binding universal stress UspA family protein